MKLKPGDRFEISGKKDAGRFPRFDYLEFKSIDDKSNTVVKNSSEIDITE